MSASNLNAPKGFIPKKRLTNTAVTTLLRERVRKHHHRHHHSVISTAPTTRTDSTVHSWKKSKPLKIIKNWK